MADILTYRVTVSAPVDADVAERVLTLVVNGAEPVISVFAPSDTDLGEVKVPQDSSVVISLVDVDDAGNRSEPAVVEFVAADTIPPGQPGSLNVTLVGETRE